MSWFSRDRDEAKIRGPVLVVEGLDVFYGRAHALQGVSLTLDHGVLGIVGRNGLGKTTLCNAITGLVPARGSVRLFGEEILGRAPNEITRRGIAYVPQGRRVWPSLSVDETLRLVARQRRELVALLTSLPPHMSFVLIEHDLDIALRVVERVTVMHNGRVLRTGTPAEIEGDAQVQAIYMGSRH